MKAQFVTEDQQAASETTVRKKELEDLLAKQRQEEETAEMLKYSLNRQLYGT